MCVVIPDLLVLYIKSNPLQHWGACIYVYTTKSMQILGTRVFFWYLTLELISKIINVLKVFCAMIQMSDK